MGEEASEDIIMNKENLVKQRTTAAAPPPKGLPGRLTKGAGTHLASWLQESKGLTAEEGHRLLEDAALHPATVRGEKAIEGLWEAHGKKAGHANTITDVAYSGDIIVTKDTASMRLWRARGDYALLRVVTAKGKHVAIHQNGQFIVTG